MFHWRRLQFFGAKKIEARTEASSFLCETRTKNQNSIPSFSNVAKHFLNGAKKT
jgi:hypothetical protein